MHMWLAIVVAAVVAMVVGSVWYGPLFGKIRMNGMGMTDKDIEDAKPRMARTYVITMLNSLVMMFVLYHFIEMSGQEGVKTAIWIWIGFLLTQQVSAYLWSKHQSLPVLLIGASYWIVVAVVSALIIGWL